MTQTEIPIPSGSLCERCQERPAVHTHHRKRRSQGGDDRNENLVRVCLECHQWIHDHPHDAVSAGWMIRSWQDPAEVKIEWVQHAAVATGREHDHLEPGEICPTCGRKKPLPRQPAKHRATVSMKVPLDELENGADLWDERIDIGRELLCPVMGWEPDVPTYYVALALVDKGLESAREDVAQLEQADA